MAAIKLLIPFSQVKNFCNHQLNGFASGWIRINGWIHRLTKKIRWEISLPDQLSTESWYLVVANHQSWVDIMALQQAFNGRIPFLKFFLKQQLIWVPVLGLAWWALDFPFMRRHSKSYLKKNPQQRGKDFETTKKACEKFKSTPISIMNFTEGTRFTAKKRAGQNSPYQHLLKPKAGGIGYVLSLMGEQIGQVIDVTIQYPDTPQFTFWDFLCGRVNKITISAQLIETPDSIKGDYINDPENRKQLQQWLNQLWHEKDARLCERSNQTNG